MKQRDIIPKLVWQSGPLEFKIVLYGVSEMHLLRI